MEWGTGICRCCLSQGEASHKDLNTTNFWMGEEEVYSEMLKECFDITLSISDPVGDSGICEMCITQLRNSFNFKKQVLHSEEQFLKRIHERIKEEESRELIKSETEDFSDDDYEPEYLDESLLTIEKVDVPIKGEMDDEEPSSSRKRTRASTKPTLKAKKAKKDDKCTKSKTQTSKRRQLVDTTFKHTKGLKNDKNNSYITEKQKHITNIHNILEYSNATPFKYNPLGYNCVYCNDSFKNPDDLRKHSRKEHDKNEINMKDIDVFNYSAKVDVKDLKCIICNTEISNLQNLKDHLRNKHSKVIYTDIPDQIIQFLLPNDRFFVCSMCDLKYDTFKYLHQHMNHHYSNFCCETCGAGYVTRNRLKRHKEKHMAALHKCGFCIKAFKTLEQKKKHENGVHKGTWKTVKCPFCDVRFSNVYSKEKHLVEIHNTEPKEFECQACERTFNHKGALTKHIKKDHLLERNYLCNFCPKRFHTKQHYDRHVVVHTGVKAFACNVCNRTFARSNTLREHMRIHTNDRRFKCAICEQTFIKKFSLKCHMKVHHPEQRYV